MRPGSAITLPSHCSLFTPGADGTLLSRRPGAGGACYGETRQRELLTDCGNLCGLGRLASRVSESIMAPTRCTTIDLARTDRWGGVCQ